MSYGRRPGGWGHAVAAAVAAAALTALFLHLPRQRELASLEAAVRSHQSRLEQLADAATRADRLERGRESVERLRHIVEALRAPAVARDPLLDELRGLLDEASLRLESRGLITGHDVRSFEPTARATAGARFELVAELPATGGRAR